MRNPPAATLLAWSFTRHQLLRACERAVFWTYWGWRGLGLDPDDPKTAAIARQAFALKHLTALPLIVGTAVHAAGRELVVSVRDRRCAPTYEELLESARLLLNQSWRCSQPDQLEHFWRWPASVQPALREVVYRGTLRPGEIQYAGDRLRTCLRNLVDAPLLDDLADAPADEVVVGFTGPESFAPAPGQVAWAALDVAYRHQDPYTADNLIAGPAWCVVDLKTGRADPEAERLQLGGYGLWLEHRGYPTTDGAYLGRIVDLRGAEDRWYRLDADALTRTRAVIADDQAHLRRLMAEAATATPLPLDRWALAQDTGGCHRCNFFALCEGDLRPLRARADAMRLGQVGTGAPDEGSQQSETPGVDAGSHD